MPARKYERATVERIRELLTYEPDTGILRWRVTRRGRCCIAGREVGCKNTSGYLVVRIDNVLYYSHILVWVLMKGEWPADEIDHIDTVEDNNMWNNLRIGGRLGNTQNQKTPNTNTSGFKGVSFFKETKKWRSQIEACGRHYHLGYYVTKEEAYAAYCQAARRLHGDFARIA